MKDIPVFTGEHGLASLILREIPRSRCAHVVVHSALPGRMAALLAECRRFCRLAGADTVLASADEPLDLPHAYDLLELACAKADLPPSQAPVALRPVTAETAGDYLRLYNELFRDVPGAAACTEADLPRMLAQERAFFALERGEITGLGQYAASELRAIAVIPRRHGLGRRLALTLFARMPGGEITLQVSSANAPALRLYEKLCFAPRRILSRWYVLTEG
ncbi:MAG: GNAT family N-acetyltransferase [Oscillospiraceae bacterium]|nr:GNAT family N-acetyltransferase [Oscillospiraceae bacterium]